MAASIFLVPNFTFVVELVIFLAVMAVMAKWILPPIRAAAATRLKGIQENVETGDRARLEADALREQRRAVLAEARGQARRLVEEATLAAEESRQAGRRRGEAEASEFLTTAQGEIAAASGRALEDALARLPEIVGEAVGRVLGSPVDMARHRAIVEAAVAEARNAA